MTFLDLCEKAAEKIKSTDSIIQLVTHNDADGITAAAIMIYALLHLNKSFQLTCVKKITNKVIDAINEKSPELTIFTDIGSSYPEELSKLNSDAIIFDHHDLKDGLLERFIHVNPEAFGVNGLSGSGTTYIFAKQLLNDSRLAPLALVGTIGDSADSIFDIFDDQPLVKRQKGLKLFGRFSRPLHKALQYESSLTNISDESKAIQFLSQTGINLKKGDEWRTLSDLNETEYQMLCDSLIKEQLNNGCDITNLFGDVWTLKNFPEELQDAKEFATLLNACGRMNEGEVGVGVCLGSKKAIERSKKIIKEYRRAINNSLRWVENHPEHIKQTDYATYILAGDAVNENIIGAIVSMCFNSSNRKPIFGLANGDDEIKVSARAINIDVNSVINQASEAVGGAGGGHCLNKDSLIQLKTGEIKNLVKIENGDRLESISLKNIKINNTTCLKKFENRNVNKAYKIRTTYGFELIASPNHKFFIVKIDNNEIKFEDKQLKNINIGDYIASVNIIIPKTKIQTAPNVNDIVSRAKKQRQWKPVKIPEKLTPELAQFLGYVIGDGHIENHDIIELKDERIEVLKTYENIIKKLFKCNNKISKIKNKNCWRLRIYSSSIAIFVERLKNNLVLIEKSPNEVVAGFLKGIFDAEGSSKARGNEVTIEMVDDLFIRKIQLLLLRFGILSSRRRYLKKYQNGTYYLSSITIRGYNLEKFKKNISFSSSEKRKNLVTGITKTSKIIPIKWFELKKYLKHDSKIWKRIHFNRNISHHEWKMGKNLIEDKKIIKKIENLFCINWVKLKEKTPIKNSEILYDLTTTEKNFVANGIIVHNSQAAGATIPKDTVDAFIRKCDELIKNSIRLD